METEKILMKIVYEDGITKVIRGYVLDVDEHCINIERENGSNIIIGKRALIKIVPVGDIE